MTLRGLNIRGCPVNRKGEWYESTERKWAVVRNGLTCQASKKVLLGLDGNLTPD